MEKEVHVDTYVDVELDLSTSDISAAIEEDETSFEDIQGYNVWPFHEVWTWVTEQDEYAGSNLSKIKELEAEVEKWKKSYLEAYPRVLDLQDTIEKQNIKLGLMDSIFRSVRALAEQMSHVSNVLETEINAVEETGLQDITTAYAFGDMDRQPCINSVGEAGPPDTFTACSDNGADHA